MKNIWNKNKKWIIFSVLMSTITSVFFFLEVYSMKYLIDKSDNLRKLQMNQIIIVLVVYTVSYILYYIKLKTNNITSYRIKKNLNDVHFSYMINSKISEFENSNKNRNMQLFFTRKVPVILRDYFGEMYDITYEAVFLIIGSLYLSVLDWKILIISVIFYYASFKLSKYFSKKNKVLIDSTNDSFSEYVSDVGEIIKSSVQLCIFGKINYGNVYSENSRESYTKSIKRMNITKNNFTIINEMLTLLREAVVLIYIVVFGRNLNLGQIFIIIYLTSMLSEPFKRLSMHINSINSTENLRTEIKKETEKEESYSHYEGEIKNIKLENIEIVKSGKQIIKKFSYDFVYPKKYLISGESGKGKTTLLNCITGMEKPKNGKVYINDRVLSDESMLYGKYIYLRHEEALFDDTLKNNITLYPESFSRRKYDEIKEKLNIVFEDNFVISNDPLNISGGEKQKILIARALYNNLKVFIFDEAFASIDKKSTEELMNYIMNLNDILLINVDHHTDNLMKDKFDEIVHI